MAETAPVRDSAGNAPASAELTNTFLKLSGYKAADISGSNQARRTFVTTNGGKYLVSKTGKALRHLLGPATPKSLAASSEESDD